ncbi:MAG: hypothetical protein Q9Q40_10210 [Acidobacteriota bacterium]|nr:hypothetical protein [Acidobacteriota bacterium]MDQ7088734.1 hypothetical protein [Acidobacteriota bacterium]
MPSVVLFLAVASLSPLPPLPSAAPPRPVDEVPVPPAPGGSQPFALEWTCTCRCGEVFTPVKTSGACEDLEGQECVTREGQLASLESCDMRFIAPDKTIQLEPGLTPIDPAE